MNRIVDRMLLHAGIICALAATASQGQVNIQYGEVNISGATLFRDFFTTPAATNDFINADWDFKTRPAPCSDVVPFAGFIDTDCFPSGSPDRDSVDQLATPYLPNITTWYLVNYRGVGSVNGVKEFVDYQLLGKVPSDTIGVAPTWNIPSDGRINQKVYSSGGSITGVGAPAGPANSTGSPSPQHSVDIAVLDVPSAWGVVAADSSGPAWFRKPAQPGYGHNPLPSYDTGYDNRLASLSRGDVALNQHVESPDANTVFDTPVTFVAIAPVANRGTGLQKVRMSELQTLFVTGRMPNGENFATVTRSVGSGTRNGAMSSIGVDSSWANGDNLGNEWTGSAGRLLGPNHRYDNCEGSTDLQAAVTNKRLGVSYNGMPGAANEANSGNSEVLNVSKDIDGDGDGLPDALPTDYVRVSKDTIIHNADPKNGWQIGGPETFVTRGDPYGTDLDIIAGAPIEIPRTNGHPAMANPAAAGYLRNILESVYSFVSSPGQDQNTNMPGEFLAYTFFLYSSVDALPGAVNPTAYSANGGLNVNLQSFVSANNTLSVPAFGSRNIAGKVPSRTSNPVGAAYPDSRYTDGSSNGAYTFDGVNYNVLGGTQLNERNQIAGDFDYSAGQVHKRNLNDISRMMVAIHSPRTFEFGIDWGGSTGSQSADKAVPEILGDHNGDGNFDDQDVRYAADGLAIDPGTGKLDRKKGFQAVDNAWTYNDVTGRPAGNYFGTVLANPLKNYVAGDSRADIAGAATAPTPGANPAGSDGVVNATDIDYVCFNTHWTEVGGLNKIRIVQPGAFSTQPRPVDLSADLNGDLTVDTLDVDEIVHVVLGTEYGDVNLDGVVNQADADIITSHLGQAGDWAAGDMNGDGMVTAADLAVWSLHVNLYAKADFNQDHFVNGQDLQIFNNCMSGPALSTEGPGCDAVDLDHDGDVDQTDFGMFQRCYSGIKPADPACG